MKLKQVAGLDLHLLVVLRDVWYRTDKEARALQDATLDKEQPAGHRGDSSRSRSRSSRTSALAGLRYGGGGTVAAIHGRGGGNSG